MNDRVDLLNYLCGRYEHPSYLEIGCRRDECFAHINAQRKVGVDPEWGGTHRLTSDEYFASHRERFDVVFIDGLHFSEQVRRDFTHAAGILNPGGVIVLHDCLPDDEHHQDPQRARVLLAAGDIGLHGVGEWTGDVWRVVVELNARNDVDVAIWPGDHGCGIALLRRAESIIMRCRGFADYQAAWKENITTVRDEAELERWIDGSDG
jgi:hypothetical protein